MSERFVLHCLEMRLTCELISLCAISGILSGTAQIAHWLSGVGLFRDRDCTCVTVSVDVFRVYDFAIYLYTSLNAKTTP
jgi:hypothetical protein